ncbi:OmpA/MotB domain-containing protein [Ectopseudomonas mendocina]|jgi:outer membrane protein OmpA-like peptidoglycan-associated protein|uniref:Glycine zipper 2TM domain-containing protein n=1 Tax=Ectopseudomonas mendocina TaxID=300 RepID=A0A379IQX9_ECTME|nr:OmpA family protein [Pseudomonas mendocina]AEB59982.1 OmpA/MotB domain-containing protein [Pseudomonas mendocina NK-01]MDF2077758.1 OmpA family protein [Pseudomonas mendocina]QTN46937.1 OmpA family protein [Pseudomonas mendocina]TRO12550.1 glycine zipper 2TM domain-containing protein [Pseudomonas mendocina]TRO14717.1 glycine zipper 2TM domain-containing protein [Pseudomonas mendocina]
MKTRRNLIAATALMAMLAGCTTNPYTGESQAGKAGIYGGIGAATGAVIGAATSSKKDRTKGALIGAAVGGAAGGGYGYYVDTQEAKLRQTLQGTGVQVQRNGDDLKLIMPGNITFASNSADISSSFYPTLNSLVLVFKEFNKNGVNIVGHTDSTGSQELNQSLSQRRAQSVANYLTANGVPGQRISAYGAGPSQPIASNATDAGRAQNRRVEINLRQL